jgi:hypothetical protein
VDQAQHHHVNWGFSYPNLRAFAEGALLSIQSNPDRSITGWPAISCILLSAASVEGYMNDLHALANYFIPADDPDARVLSLVLDALEERRASVQTRYAYVYRTFKGKEPDKGDTPWQEFRLLFRVRDALVHPRPIVTVDGKRVFAKGDVIQELRSGHKDLMWETPVEVIAALRSEHSDLLAAFPEPFDIDDVLHSIATKAAAQRAFDTAVQTVTWLRDALPDSYFGTSLKP